MNDITVKEEKKNKDENRTCEKVTEICRRNTFQSTVLVCCGSNIQIFNLMCMFCMQRVQNSSRKCISSSTLTNMATIIHNSEHIEADGNHVRAPSEIQVISATNVSGVLNLDIVCIHIQGLFYVGVVFIF